MLKSSFLFFKKLDIISDLINPCVTPLKYPVDRYSCEERLNKERSMVHCVNRRMISFVSIMHFVVRVNSYYRNFGYVAFAKLARIRRVD